MTPVILIVIGLCALYTAWYWMWSCPADCMADDLKSGRVY